MMDFQNDGFDFASTSWSASRICRLGTQAIPFRVPSVRHNVAFIAVIDPSPDNFFASNPELEWRRTKTKRERREPRIQWLMQDAKHFMMHPSGMALAFSPLRFLPLQ
jgi:hypothetical protein